MSSILEALKKLEAESPDSHSAGLWRWSAGSATAAYPRIRNIRRINPKVLILSSIALLLILIAIFGLTWFRRPQPIPISSSGPVDPTPARKDTISSKQTTQKNTAPLIQVSPSSGAPSNVPLSKIVPLPATAAPPTIALVTPPPMSQKAAVKPPVPEPVRQPRTDEPKTPMAPSSKAQTAPPAAPTIAAKPYHGDTPIKVQAIAWSDNPAQRLAVINDTVAREGQFIGDILVVGIQPEKIIIRKGGVMWELIFRHQ